DVLAITSPNALLIESTLLSERVEKDRLIIKYRSKRGKTITVSNRVKQRLFQYLEKTFEVNSNDQIVGYESDAKIRRNP
ncbi:hypothetical protein CGJ01_23030, partial [Vibrio parahaemolyticus]